MCISVCLLLTYRSWGVTLLACFIALSLFPSVFCDVLGHFLRSGLTSEIAFVSSPMTSCPFMPACSSTSLSASLFVWNRFVILSKQLRNTCALQKTCRRNLNCLYLSNARKTLKLNINNNLAVDSESGEVKWVLLSGSSSYSLPEVVLIISESRRTYGAPLAVHVGLKQLTSVIWRY